MPPIDHASTHLRWYLACEGSKFSESRADDIIERYGAETYTPKFRKMVDIPLRELTTRQRQQRKSGMVFKRSQLVPMFRGYRLIRFDLGRKDWREMFERANMFGIICYADNDRLLPKPIPDSALVEFRRREAQGSLPGSISARALGVAIGDAVRIHDGHMSGFTGIVDRIPDLPIEEVDEDTRVRVALLMFGRVTPVHVPLSHLQRLD